MTKTNQKTMRNVCQFKYDNEKKFGLLQFHGMCLLACVSACVCVCEYTHSPPYNV